jgi:hypothetical protein
VQGKARTYEVASHDSLPCKPSHNWSPNVFFHVSTEWVMMCPAIDKPASSEILTVVRSLCAKNVSSAEIHCELCAVYDQNVMSEGTVRQWCRMFKDGWKNGHDEERNGQASVLSDDLFQIVDKKFCETRLFTISELSCEFPQISGSILYEIITISRGYHCKCCARWVPKIFTSGHKKQRIL